MGSVRLRRWSATTAFVAALLVLGASGAVGDASTPSFATPQSRLDELRRHIERTERDAARLHEELLSSARRVSEAEGEQAELLTRIGLERDRLDAARVAYHEAKELLDDRVRAAYMGGPGTVLEAVLGAPTLGDLTLVLETQDRQAADDRVLAIRTGDLERAAAETERTVSALLTRQSSLLDALDDRRRSLADRLTAQRRLITELTAARAELELLARRTHMRSGRPTGMTIGFEEWATRFLTELAVPVCRYNQIAVVAWETAEYTAAAWNPLATTLDMPGATDFNSAGVKNYRSLDQGLRATVSTLLRGVTSYGYGAIIAALANCEDPAVTAEAIAASSWCHGCAGGHYVTALIPAVEESFGA
ncbi:MAG: coiled-coil domain-containing protein [Actinomycetota bacterium]